MINSFLSLLLTLAT